MTIGMFSLSMISSMVVDRPIPGVDHELQERVGVRIVGAGPHLHGEQEEENEAENADEREPPGVPSAGPWSG